MVSELRPFLTSLIFIDSFSFLQERCGTFTHVKNGHFRTVSPKIQFETPRWASQLTQTGQQVATTYSGQRYSEGCQNRYPNFKYILELCQLSLSDLQNNQCQVTVKCCFCATGKFFLKYVLNLLIFTSPSNKCDKLFRGKMSRGVGQVSMVNAL